MERTYIFDIPIYRCSENDDAKAVRSSIEKDVASLLPAGPIADSARLRLRAYRESTAGGWQFSQVVGWLRLYAEPHRIEAEPWWVDARRIGRLIRRRNFVLVTMSNTLGTWFHPDCSSSEIFEQILTHLEHYAQRPSLKNRFVDIRTFRHVGSYIDWRRLVDDQLPLLNVAEDQLQ